MLVRIVFCRLSSSNQQRLSSTQKEVIRRVAAHESQESLGAHFEVKRQAIGYIISNKDMFNKTEINLARK